jgi:hypothetical protein
MSWRADKLELQHPKSLMEEGIHKSEAAQEQVISSERSSNDTASSNKQLQLVKQNYQLLLEDQANHEVQLEDYAKMFRAFKESIHNLHHENNELKRQLKDWKAENYQYMIEDLEEQIKKWQALYFESAEMGSNKIESLEKELEYTCLLNVHSTASGLEEANDNIGQFLAPTPTENVEGKSAAQTSEHEEKHVSVLHRVKDLEVHQDKNGSSQGVLASSGHFAHVKWVALPGESTSGENILMRSSFGEEEGLHNADLNPEGAPNKPKPPQDERISEHYSTAGGALNLEVQLTGKATINKSGAQAVEDTSVTQQPSEPEESRGSYQELQGQLEHDDRLLAAEKQLATLQQQLDEATQEARSYLQNQKTLQLKLEQRELPLRHGSKQQATTQKEMVDLRNALEDYRQQNDGLEGKNRRLRQEQDSLHVIQKEMQAAMDEAAALRLQLEQGEFTRQQHLEEKRNVKLANEEVATAKQRLAQVELELRKAVASKQEVFQRSNRAIAKLQSAALEEQQLLKDKTEKEVRAALQREEEQILKTQSASKARDALAAQVQSIERRLQQAKDDSISEFARLRKVIDDSQNINVSLKDEKLLDEAEAQALRRELDELRTEEQAMYSLQEHLAEQTRDAQSDMDKASAL